MKGIYKKQYAYIKKHFGEKSAKYANYGWVVDGNCYMTKVYTSPPSFVYTIFSKETDKMETFTYKDE